MLWASACHSAVLVVVVVVVVVFFFSLKRLVVAIVGMEKFEFPGQVDDDQELTDGTFARGFLQQIMS